MTKAIIEQMTTVSISGSSKETTPSVIVSLVYTAELAIEGLATRARAALASQSFIFGNLV
jgi:hypothetical protein